MKTEKIFIILSGGSGSRFSKSKAKQLQPLAGKAVLEYCIKNISEYKNIDKIIVVASSKTLSETKKIIQNINDKRISIIVGGNTRLESSYFGVRSLETNENSYVLIHDGARPFLPHTVIEESFQKLDQYDAIDVLVPSADTIVKVNDRIEEIDYIPERRVHYRGQTPQGFKVGQVLHAYEKVISNPELNFSDDCGVFIHAFPKSRIGVVRGSESNIKITYPFDLIIAEQIIKEGLHFNSTKTNIYPKEINGQTIVIFGGNSGLGLDIKMKLKKIGAKVFSASRVNGVDINDSVSVRSFLKSIEKKGIIIDAIINTAGILGINELHEMTDDLTQNLINTNFSAGIFLAKISFDFLKKSEGHLINFSSSSFSRGRRGYAAYSAAKAGIVNFTQAISEEWSDFNIKVNCIIPRRAATPMRFKAFPNEDPKTLLKPEKVSEKVIEVLRRDITGQIIHVK